MRSPLILAAAAALAACDDAPTAPLPPLPPTEVAYTQAREPCADRAPLRRALYGDLHVHTGFSFDAYAYENHLTPDDAYRFAQGEAVQIAPTAAPRTVQLDRPLDFVAVTDHGDLLGEVHQCTDPAADGFSSPRCAVYRSENGAFEFGTYMASPAPAHDPRICGPDGARCRASAEARWGEMLAAAEAHDDRSAACRFTAFPAYEYTNTLSVSNLHRNVVFRSAVVPPAPIGYQEAPSPLALWQQLDEACVQPGDGCDVVVLPHNSNLSNGQLFYPGPPDAEPAETRRAHAALRARMEPVVEIFQHKGDSECRNGFPGVEDDPACDFEKLRPPDTLLCPDDQPGSGGMRLWGCLHRLDFVRNVLLAGLEEEARTGLNPYRLGFIGSTDTHNGTPGHVAVAGFPGHIGVVDDTPAERLAEGNITHDGFVNNPGGLAAVWAVENSRDAIFDALRRRETFATSGPRMAIRLFAGALPEGLCGDPDRLRHGYASGAPMGGVIGPADAPPRFFVEALADDGGARTPLATLQIVKGWREADGTLSHRVYDVAGGPSPSVDPIECAPGEGAERLCADWVDPDFDPARPAFYYARALEVRTCRWSTGQCNAFPEGARPPRCDDPAQPKTVQQRAWSSPIWFDPTAP